MMPRGRQLACIGAVLSKTVMCQRGSEQINLLRCLDTLLRSLPKAQNLNRKGMWTGLDMPLHTALLHSCASPIKAITTQTRINIERHKTEAQYSVSSNRRLNIRKYSSRSLLKKINSTAHHCHLCTYHCHQCTKRLIWGEVLTFLPCSTKK
jgi:hypothetical protein